ncbi:MAG TPA: FtsX-like permease family protein [Thermoanaerobaculia bacterium]
MSGILSDARYALRTLIRYPRFNLAALLLLALGIGANTVIFSVLDGARAQGHAPPAAAIAEIEISAWLLAGLLGCTLLLICANVARLLLVRDAGRRRELALRGALGASRSRLVRQLLTESVVLALLGGGAGLLLAAAGIDLAEALAPAGPGRLPQFQVNGRVVLYAAALALAAGYACGLLPALRVTLGSLGEGLRASGQGAPAAPRRRRRRPHRWFLAGEVALALVLLASAGLEIKNFYLFMAIDPGFAPRRAVLTASVQLPASPGGRYAGGDVRADFFQRLLERAARLPGVAAAAAISSLPARSTEDISFTIDGSTAAAGGALPQARVIQVTPACLQVLGVPIRRGRPFGADDTGDARGGDRPLPAAIVNQEFVREYSSGAEPLGRWLVFPSLPGPAAWQIVGVVADVRQDGMESPAPPIVYLPYWQHAPLHLAGAGVSMNLLLRAAGDRDAAFLAAPLRQALATIDPQLALADPRTAAELFDRMAAGSRPRLLLMTLFAGFFVALAAVGIYGAVSWSVAQRSREIAIRVAVGANRRAVLREVIREGVALASLGTALGLGAFVVFGSGLSKLCMPLEGDRLWYGPALGVLAALSMLAVGALASWLPAARAARLDLSAALRDS